MIQHAVPEIPEPVRTVLQSYPARAQAKFMDVRQMIFEEAERLGVGPLEETLKWGEPSYLTPKTKAGTTIRIGWSAKREDKFGLFFNCKTDLVSRLRGDFPIEFEYEGTRAATVPLDHDLPDFATRAAVAMALNYHRDKKQKR
ncbi:hypothetical protein [Planktotalea sp.]|uniref:hypothetical protein n=1 Tax=Planktotalea sp. TaxID=2029877 RepID=UPI0032981846